MSRRLIHYSELPSKGVRYTRAHLARRIKARTFPQPIVLCADAHGTPKRIAWVEEEIDEWINDMIAQRAPVPAE